MKWLHNLLKGMSLTAALFVFQACYGTPTGYPEPEETVVEETVLVEETVSADASQEAAAVPEAEE